MQSSSKSPETEQIRRSVRGAIQTKIGLTRNPLFCPSCAIKHALRRPLYASIGIVLAQLAPDSHWMGNGKPGRAVNFSIVIAPRAVMPLRSVWKGSLRFSLVSVPVEAYTAAERGDGEIHFNQLHDTCHSRIRYKKTCPIHGEVANDEIVSGYEYEKDKYVVFDPGELNKLRPEGNRTISIDTFITPDEVDPIYYDGRTYYLAPDSAAAEKPYAVLSQAMSKMKRYGMASVILHGKEELVLIRPLKGLLTMTMLHYASQVRDPSVLKDELPNATANPQELKLAQQLIEASTSKRFDFSRYEDTYSEELKKLIEAKVAGREIVAPPAASEEETPIINLMDALRKSVQQNKREASSGRASKARKSLTSQLSKPSGTARRRKTS